MTKSYTWIRTFMAGLMLASSMLLPNTAAAQSGVTLTINSCDDQNYPEISCVVTPVDQAGLPLQGLTASSFEVLDQTTALTDVQAEQIQNAAVKTNIMLIVDFGTNSRNQTLVNDLRGASESVINQMGTDDNIALLGVTGKIELGDTLNPPINPAKESGFVNAGQDRNSIINVIRTLAAQQGTPLYDAVFKGLIISSKQSVGSRAVILLSDGRDAKSTTYTPDDPINRATKDRTPVFTIGIGPKVDTAYMQRLASQTGGSYFAAAVAAEVGPKFIEIQKILKTQYRLSFKAVTPPDNKPEGYPLTIRLNVPAGRAAETTNFKALFPIKPIVNSATFKQGDTEFDLSVPLPFGEIEITPNIQARSIARVEYVVDGEVRKVAESAPYTFVLDVTDPKLELDPEREHVLIVRAYGELTNPGNITEAKYTFNVLPAPTPTPVPVGTPVPGAPKAAAPQPTVGKGTPVPTAIPLPTPVPSFGERLAGSPGLLIGVLLGALALAGLIAALIISRRRAAAARIAAAANEPQTIFETGGALPEVNNQTRVFSTGAMSGVTDNRTKVFRAGKATLEFMTGAMKDKKFQVGIPGTEAITLGRDIDVNGTNIKIESEFVSRKHAKIALEGDKLFLYDLGSSSGTRVNGTALSGRTEIKDGDVLEFADVTATVRMAIVPAKPANATG